MRSRRTAAVVAAVVAVLCALSFAPSASAAGGGECQLKGTASFSPGLNTTAQPFTYSFTGDLTGCQSTEAGSPAAGTVQAGGTYTDTATGNVYTLPDATGSGSCGSSTTAGFAVLSWADGTRTLIDYTTSGVAAAVKLDGTVAESRTLTPVDPLDPPLTLTTTRYSGYTPFGLLAFEASPDQCVTGVAAAGIEGVVGLGQQ
jgi:hypothetical protein